MKLVETALILPLLIVLLLGVAEFGFLFYAHVQVANAAREAARAASLYASTRYSTADTSTSCSGSIDGWALQDAVDQAVVSRALDGKGCRNASGSIVYTSLGRLDPAPVSPDTIKITISDVADSGFWNTSTNSQKTGGTMPQPGTSATVTVVYPYRLTIVSNLIPFLSNPISISKSVRVEFSQ